MKTVLKRILAAGVTAAITVTACGCSIKTGTHKKPKPDSIVAQPTAGGADDTMSIKYEDFEREYNYYLVNSNIEDDTLETVTDKCKEQRNSIITYLINERIILQKAKEMSIYDLTEEEQAAVDKDFDEKMRQQIQYYGILAEMEMNQTESGSSDSNTSNQSNQSGDSTQSDVTLTDEEKEKLGEEKLDEMLKKCGMTRDDIKQWAVSSKITEKVRDKIAESVTYASAEEEYKKVIEQAKQLYETNIDVFQSYGYNEIWLPENSRMIKHVLIGFDSETQQKIRSLRNESKTEEADKLREESAAALKDKVDEVEKKLNEGANIDDLIKEYSADASGSQANPNGYTVIPNGTTFMEEFQQAAFVPEKIGDRTTCVTDYGVHIMLYAADAKVPDETVKTNTEYLLEQLKSKAFSDKMSEWKAEYAFEIDYEALRLDIPEESSAADSSGNTESSANSVSSDVSQ